MSGSENNPSDDDVDALYRRASSRDSSRPSESVRRRVLRHGADLASTARDANAGPQRTANRAWRRPVTYACLAAAALAGLMIFPPWLPPSPQLPATTRKDDIQAPRPEDVPAATSAGRQLDEQYSAKLSARGSFASAAAVAPARAAAPPMLDATVSLRQAAEVGDVPRLQVLLGTRVRVDVNGRDSGGRTALMLAVLNGRTGAVHALLAGGADANAADASGTTPLQVAVARDQPDIAAALRRAGAR